MRSQERVPNLGRPECSLRSMQGGNCEHAKADNSTHPISYFTCSFHVWAGFFQDKKDACRTA